MSANSSLGSLIRERRLARGYSLGQLASEVGATAANVRSWERDQESPDTQQVPRLAEALDLETGAIETLIVVAAEPVEAVADPRDEAYSDSGATSAVTVVGVEDEPEVGEEVEPEVGEEESPADELGGEEPEDSDVAAEAAAGSPVDQDDDEAAATEDAVVTGDSEADEAEATAVPVSAEVADEDEPSSDEVAAVAEEPTEAMPPPVATPPPAAAAAGVPTAQSKPPGPVGKQRAVAEIGPPPPLQFPNPLKSFFDPHKRWLYYLRITLTIIVLFVLARVFFWALGELWTALGEVLDSIESTETEELTTISQILPG